MSAFGGKADISRDRRTIAILSKIQKAPSGVRR
jgi:hypothetical protein